MSFQVINHNNQETHTHTTGLNTANWTQLKAQTHKHLTHEPSVD